MCVNRGLSSQLRRPGKPRAQGLQVPICQLLIQPVRHGMQDGQMST